MQDEPGSGGDAVRLTISGKRKEEERLNRLKHKLEAKDGERLSVSRVFWLAIECLAEAEGVK